MPRSFVPYVEKIRNFPIRDDDIWIVTFPKSGTTWTQEMIWMIINNVDMDQAASPLFQRSPFLEFGCLRQDLKEDPLETAEKLTRRRVLKTHLPFEFLPPDIFKRCKVVYVARDPRDVCVSYFHHMSAMFGLNFTGNFDDFAELFKDDLQPYGSYWHHVLSGWKQRDHPNVKMIWYEDMKKDQEGAINELCEFLEHPLSSSQVQDLVNHLKFENMKKNPNVNISLKIPDPKGNFMRKGKVGDWKNFFGEEKAAEWQQWIKKQTDSTGLDTKICTV